MLKELVHWPAERVSRLQGTKHLEQTRYLLEKFLKGGKQVDASLMGRALFGKQSETYRRIRVKIERKAYSLKISTPSLLRPWDNSEPIFLTLSNSLNGRELNSVELPTRSTYSNLEDEKRWGIDHKVRLLNKDIIPMVKRDLKKLQRSKK